MRTLAVLLRPRHAARRLARQERVIGFMIGYIEHLAPPDPAPPRLRLVK